MLSNNVHPLKDEYVIEVEVKDTTIILWARKRHKPDRNEFNSYRMCDFYLGEHMVLDPVFTGEGHVNLRRMIGERMATAIRQATESGYRMAQRDIQIAIGL